MRGNLLTRMNQDAALYIDLAPQNAYLGITDFATSASTLHNLIRINGAAERERLTNALPPEATGQTCIGCGVLEGIEVLKQRNGRADGGRLVLITDGIENRNPRIRDVIDDAVNNNIVVDTIQYTALADPNVQQLSDATGGSYYNDAGSETSVAMIRGLIETLSTSHIECTTRLYPVLHVDSYRLTRNVLIETRAIVDSSVGYQTQFSFTYPPGSSSNVLGVTLTSPVSGTVYRSSDAQYTTHNSVIGAMYLRIPDRAEIGNWTIVMTTTSTITTRLVVTSTTSSPQEHPIQATASIIGHNRDLSLRNDNSNVVRIFTRVSQGSTPVLGVTAAATVTVDSPPETFTVELFDNGKGIDMVANDGVYTGMFVQFTRNSRFAVNVDVSNSHRAASIQKRSLEVGDFERTSAAGFFTVSNYPTDDGTVPNILPPARVTDLRFIRASEESLTVELQWTAVGADWYDGRASRYEMRHCTNNIVDDFPSCDLVLQSQLQRGDLSHPSASGVREIFVISVTKEHLNRTESYALKVYDQDDLESEMSNIAQAFLPVIVPQSVTTEVVTPETTKTQTSAMTARSTGSLTSTTLKYSDSDETDSWLKTILILSSVNTLIIVCLLIIVIFLAICLCKKNKVTPDSRPTSPYPSTITTSKVGLLMDVESVAAEDIKPEQRPVTPPKRNERPPSQAPYAWSSQGSKN